MNNIHNIICPGCGSTDHIENILKGEVWLYWDCNSCKTRIHTEIASGKITSYMLKTTYKNIRYEGIFYLWESTFQLGHYNVLGVWCPLFKLSFLPRFDANNFTQKLPTLLTFH